jgi:hypothetical protein
VSVYCHPHDREGRALEVALAVAADYANVTNDGKLNVMGIFQQVNPTQFPMALPQMFLVVAFEAGPAEIGTQKDVRIIFMDDDGEHKLMLDLQLVVPEPVRPGSPAYFNQIVGLGGLPLEKSGDHAFFILIGGEERGRVTLHVNEPPAEDSKGDSNA